MAKVGQTYQGSWISSSGDIEKAFPENGKP